MEDIQNLFFSHSLSILVAGSLLVAGIFYFIMRKAAARRKENQQRLGMFNDIHNLNKLHDKKSGVSMKTDKVPVQERKYFRKMSNKEFHTRKRMFNESRKRCRGKK